ncbi:zinc finger protein 618 isoform X11 [Panthera tigris]|uniref:zinc finger protein 618 isoform X11 n=1 Tax=Panthera leo TaxID=9689 RepID=UPI001C698BFC|nr:zinc finger protein 618 isoform X11 [Panthera leo]XP_042821237.1 zinc finger protein 618 isoform X11 [Panthera tigris]
MLLPLVAFSSSYRPHRVQADGASAAGRKSTASRERLKRSQKSTKVEGPEPVPAEASLSAEQGTMTEVKVKTELPDDYIQEVIWQGEAKEEKKVVSKDGPGDVPAEICVVIGGVRNQQTLDGKAPEGSPHGGSVRSRYSGTWIFDQALRYASGSYECGICGKKYKYYNCFQTHVRAHRDTEATSGEGASQGTRERQAVLRLSFHFPDIRGSDNFRYTCDICGKKYKYYSCFQEHRDLHAVDVFSVEGAPENRADPFDQGVVATDEVKEEPPEPFQKIGPMNNITSEIFKKKEVRQCPKRETGNYTCEFCGKQYKYYTPYQEHVALHAPITESAFSRRVEGKAQNHFEETNSSSQNSSETASPLISNPFPLLQKPYTCGACGIQFQFYNNLLEHMQSHAADNENNIASNQSRSPPAVVEEKWKPQAQRNSANNTMTGGLTPNSMIPEKERQNIAERLLRVMCADLGALSVVSGKEFLKLAQTLVDSGARYGAFSVTEILGNFNTLALKHLPRMYNQVKVKVTCALGSNACLGIGVTCHSQSVGPDSCYILTAYQAEGNHIKSYVLGVKGADIRDSGDLVHHWVQNVLSEFVMSEIRTVYVTDCRVSASAFSKAGMCLRCSACALNSVVQSVLSKRTLQARSMHEVIELLNVCEDLAGSTGLAKETFGSLEETSPPPCWNSVTDSLLLVHERYEQICEFYSRAKKMNLIQSLNKHLLSNLAAILTPVKQAVIELSNESQPTLQLVLPTYVRLEKLFTAKANDAGTVSKLCHLFLEALKENFKVHPAHKVAMILDPQQKLRPVPPYQHEEIIGKVCELINEVKESWAEEADFEPSAKKPRSAAGENPAAQEDDRLGKNEVYDYLQEPLFQATPDLFQYWSCVTQKHTKLAKLAFWLLAVPAVGARSGCVNMCEQALLIKRRRLLSPEDMNKLMFLKSNML